MNNLWEIIIPLMLLLLWNLPGIIQALTPKNKEVNEQKDTNEPEFRSESALPHQEAKQTSCGFSEELSLSDLPPVPNLQAPVLPEQITSIPVQSRQMVAPAARLAELLSSPVEVKQAFLLAEILRRPDDRWQ